MLEETPEDVIEQRDLYDRPPSIFKSWAKGNVVMIGDAVHPMMPNLGQGGCQAIEDAYVLAQRLGAVKDREQVPFTLQVMHHLDATQKELAAAAMVSSFRRLGAAVARVPALSQNWSVSKSSAAQPWATACP